jgi:hypothetical protein
LTPTVGNREEQIFYLTQTEVLAMSGSMIGAMARAQAAVSAGDEKASSASSPHCSTRSSG